MKTLKTLGFVAIFSFVLAACTPDPEVELVYSGPAKSYSGASFEVYEFVPALRSGITHALAILIKDPSSFWSLSDSRLKTILTNLGNEAEGVGKDVCKRRGQTLNGFYFVEDATRADMFMFALECK